MNRIQTCIALTTLATGLGFSSCSDDDNVDWAGVEISNTELKSVLQTKGFTFNEEGKLVQDDKVKSTTALDLSKCSLSDPSGLDVFPNLTEVNLSDNKFTYSFDFSKLPAQITSIDLTGNEIYEYPGLVKIETQENGDEDVTVLHKLAKLSLPESAKYNCNEIVAFYSNVTGIDIQMVNSSGLLEAYNTLRKVPDAGFRTILKKTFPSLFNGDNIDISKRLVNSSEAGQTISTVNMEEKTMAVDDVDGFQYIMNNKGYRGTYIILETNEVCTVPYFPVNSSINEINLKRISTPNGIDLSQATKLTYLITHYNPAIKSLDFSASTTLGQRGDEAEKGSFPSFIRLCSCESLKTVTFPKTAIVLRSLEFTNCPDLEEVNLSQFQTIGSLAFGLLSPSCKITYLTPIRLLNDTKLGFGVDEDIYNRETTKAFLDAYHEQLGLVGLTRGHGAKDYNWTKNYK